MTTPTFTKTHNIIAYLAKPTESDGFEQIIDFLNRSSIKYALTTSPTIRTSCIKQFSSTAKVKTVNDKVRVQALIDGNRVNIKESSIRRTLNLDDEEVLKPPPRMNLAALWHQQSFSLQKTRSLTSPATKEVGQALDDVFIPTEPSTSKPHKKPKSKKQQPIAPKIPSPKPSPVHQLPSPSTDPIPDADKDNLKFQELMNLCTRLSNKVLDLESKVIDIKSSFTARIQKLEDRVDQLEATNKALKEKSFKTTQVDTAVHVENMEKSFKQERMIADMDEDVEVNLQEAQAKAYNLDLQHLEKILSMQDIDEEEPTKVEEVLEVVTAAKLIIEVVTTTAPTTADQVSMVSALRKRMDVVIQDPEEKAASVIVHSEIDMDEAFARQLEAELNANINWNDVMEQVKRSERRDNTVMRYQALKRKHMAEAHARKNIMIYLKNMVGFKMDFFKGMTYSEIRPIFEKHYNSIQAFLEKEEEVTIQEKEIEKEGHKRQGESLKHEIAKKQKTDEEEEELKRHLQIVANDDDVFTEATPLALKLVKERFETIEPKNFSDDFLLNTLKIMFEKPNVEANVWRDQNGRYGLAKVKSWKLFESCGVHVITFTTTQMILLVEKKYPLTHFTLQQMLDNVRLEVKEESEMSLELLRLVRRQLNEGYVPE
uniref:Uncharacterized protein n=1 Tax=Tanacetum cinerariifolium TaxID=118510 RepID=A0A6L2KS84_TANCI|nr:hypothetical protein [Tanacetum cinerariifolium]